MLRGPLFLQAAIYSLVGSGVPALGEDSKLTTVQYIFTAVTITTYCPVGLVALYHLSTDQTLHELKQMVNSIYFSSLIFWTFTNMIFLHLVYNRKSIRMLFKNMLQLREFLLENSLKKKVLLFILTATAMSVVEIVLNLVNIFVGRKVYSKRLGISNGEVAAVMFLPGMLFWQALYINMNARGIFDMFTLEAIGQQTVSACRCSSSISVLCVDREGARLDVGTTESRSSLFFRFTNSRSRLNLLLGLLSMLKRIRCSGNQIFFFPFAVLVAFYTNYFLTLFKFKDRNVPLAQQGLALTILMLLTILPIVSLCGFNGLFNATSQSYRTTIKREMYLTQNVRKRHILSKFASSIADTYPDHACVLFCFDFALLAVFADTMFVVITTLYST